MKFALVSPEARLPQFMTEGAAGMDFFAHLPQERSILIPKGSRRRISLGVKPEVPSGFGLFLFSRSGWAGFNEVAAVAGLTNCVGVIDSDYRGEIFAVIEVKECSDLDMTIHHGDRIVQGVLLPILRSAITEVTEAELSATVRGGGGFGSTNRT